MESHLEPLETLGEAAVPHMERFVRRLLPIAESLLDGQPQAPTDNLGFMALMFLAKQADHMKSILELVPRRDVVLIARSMIEGACQLLWTSMKPETRSHAWRSFAVIHDWRLMCSRIAEGVPVPASEKARIEKRLAEEGRRFLTKKGRQVRKTSGAVTDRCYHSDWRCGTTINDTCVQADAADLYSTYYRHYSDWHHWGVGGLGYAVAATPTGYKYVSNSWGFSSGALDTAVRCLLETCRTVASHFGRSQLEDIDALGHEYLLWTTQFGETYNEDS